MRYWNDNSRKQIRVTATLKQKYVYYGANKNRQNKQIKKQ